MDDRKSVLTGQTVQWMKNVQCCGDSVTAKLKQTRAGQTDCPTAPNNDSFLSLSLSPSLSLSLSVSHLTATEQKPVLCRRESGFQLTVPKNQYHQMIKVRYQSLGTKLVSTHKLGGFLL